MKQRIKGLLFILLLSIPFVVDAQVRGARRITGGGFSSLGRQGYKEVIFGIGASNFLGELGGANQIGTNFVRDFDIESTKPSAQISYRIKLDRWWAIKYGFYYQRLSGDDKLTSEIYRRNRNLSFRANVFEVSGQIELYFTKQEQLTKRYKIQGTKGKKIFNIQGYAFIGLGTFFFNPKAMYDGKWVALQPLGTEGQGLPNAQKKYSRVSICIPYGIGFKQPLDKHWYAGVEFGFRKTFTDYLDDVSNVYYNNAVILSERGDKAAYLADPKLYYVPIELDPTGIYKRQGGGMNQGGPGQQRGDVRDKDSYMFVNITIGYKLDKRRSSFQRKFNRHF